MGASGVWGDPKTVGAWLVHHTNKLQEVNGATSYDNILVAGKAAILLSALSATEESHLGNTQVDALARSANVNRLELAQLLKILADRRLINVGGKGIDVLGVTTSTVLERASDIFEELKPSSAERASIGIAELTSAAPIQGSEAEEWASDTFRLSKGELADFFESSESLGFVDYEDLGNERVYFNGNLFRHDGIDKITRVLESLTDAERRLVSEVEERLKRNGCLTLDDVERVLGKPLLEKLNAISMYDINVVSNERENVAYVSRPAAFGKFGNPFADDALDLAKALVSSLTYGMTRRDSGEGRINAVKLLLGKLVRGEWIGSATAIGQDYRALEMRRVVEVRSPGRDGYGYDMHLLKREVGEVALDVVQHGDASLRSLPNFGGVAVTKFVGPEANRFERRKAQAPQSKRATRDIVMALRTGGIR